MEALYIACAGFFMICSAIFFYYLFLTVKSYLKCKSEMKDELPCPSTCNPGYECKQSDAPADFVIGEVVEGAEGQPVAEEMPELIPEETPRLIPEVTVTVTEASEATPEAAI